jgi:hypothetical protein
MFGESRHNTKENMGHSSLKATRVLEILFGIRNLQLEDNRILNLLHQLLSLIVYILVLKQLCENSQVFTSIY